MWLDPRQNIEGCQVLQGFLIQSSFHQSDLTWDFLTEYNFSAAASCFVQGFPAPSLPRAEPFPFRYMVQYHLHLSLVGKRSLHPCDVHAGFLISIYSHGN